MNTRRLLLTPVVLTIFIVSLAFTSSTHADPGSPFWSVYVGNSWTYDGSDLDGGSWTWLDEIVGSDTTTIPEVRTYRHNSYEDGWYEGSEWYSISSTEMKLWKEEFFDFETISTIYDGGLVVAKNPFIVGDYWTTETTGTVSGSGNGEYFPPWSCPVYATFEVTVLAYEFVTTTLGNYKAYKMRYIYHVWSVDPEDQIEGSGEYYQWIVPYLGIVKWQSVLVNEIVTNQTEVLSSMTIKKEIVDYDADAKTDIAIYRESTGAWYVTPSGGGSPYGLGWGGDPSDKPVPGDYNGDGKTDIAVYRASIGTWYVYPSGGGLPYEIGWGGNEGDKPVPGDYDGDAKTDVAIYRISTGAWWIIPSSGAGPYGVGWGGDETDKPVPGDYDGDGKTDIAVYRASTGNWYVIPSSGAPAYGVGWGGTAFTPVPADYDGDGKTDVAVYEASTGMWWIVPSSGAPAYGVGWGGVEFTPVPADYDGDGKTDAAVYEASTGMWWIVPSSGAPAYGVGLGGESGDVPLTTIWALY